MPKKMLYCALILLAISCKSSYQAILPTTALVKVDTLFTDKISIRAIAVSGDKVYYAADRNRVGYKNLYDGGKFEREIKMDTLRFEFRSIAVTQNYVYALTVGNPALLYRFSKDLKEKELVYTEKHENVFYDSMQFWNDREGIAVGDPTTSCFSVIITRDGGKTWTKSPCTEELQAETGEAFFAASNTNVIVKGNHTWLVSGGKKSRVLYSSDKGVKWKVYQTPIIQGGTMTGLFSADFYDENTGFGVGGDYEKQNQNFGNKIVTHNGGKKWSLIAENTGFGYASCVQYFPESKGQKLLCVGGTGVYISNDKGITWTQLSTDNSLYTIRFIDAKSAVLAGKNKIVTITF